MKRNGRGLAPGRPLNMQSAARRTIWEQYAARRTSTLTEFMVLCAVVAKEEIREFVFQQAIEQVIELGSASDDALD